MTSRTRALALVALAAVGGLAVEGGLPGSFLNYGAGPRSLAMGKAFTAVADDAQAVYFNPAGLYQLNAQEILLAHSQLYLARMEYIAYAIPTREFGTFGINLINYGSEQLDSRDPRNYQYEPTAFAENAYMASYSYNPWHFLGFGGTLKLITKNLAEHADVTFGGDLGLIVKLPRPFSFGISAQNLLQPVIELVSLQERYPRTLRAGAAVRLLNDRVTVAFDASATNFLFDSRRDVVPHGGVEFAIVPGVLIQRVGFDPNEISLGLGVHKAWGKMALGVDYAFLLHHQSRYRLDPTHKLGLFLTFSGFRVWIQATPRVFAPTPEDRQNVLWMDVGNVSRAAVKRWQLLLKNSYGEVVRSFSGWEAPPLRLTWDGLDDAGRLVADGRYYYDIVVVDQRNSTLSHSGPLTEVRTQGPGGRIEIRPGR
ncbi:hypothetical protein FJY71_03470 [candidate division WOR-3 bacterium]|nr:hypothetical protein [candidate division WOR-3 bacterium]